jgi:hypothetical protein
MESFLLFLHTYIHSICICTCMYACMHLCVCVCTYHPHTHHPHTHAHTQEQQGVRAGRGGWAAGPRDGGAQFTRFTLAVLVQKYKY